MTRCDVFSLGAAALLGLGSGWLVHGWLATKARTAPAPGAAPVAPAPVATAAPPPAARTVPTDRVRVLEAWKHPLAFRRRLEGLPLLARLPAAELGVLARERKSAGPPGDDLLLATLTRLALHDLAQALQLATERGRSGVRDAAALEVVLRVMAATRPEAAGRWLQTLPPADRRSLEKLWLNALATEDPAAALAAWSQSGTVDASAVREPLRRLAQQSVADAMKLAFALPSAQARAVGVAAVLSVWRSADPLAATQWLLAQSDLPNRKQLLRETTVTGAEREPRALAELLLRGAAEGETRELLSRVLGAWARRDFADALSWYQAQNPTWRGELLTELLPQWAKRDPAAALTAVLELPPTSEVDRLVGESVGGWKSQDAAGARAWVQVLPPGRMRAQALSALILDRGGEIDLPNLPANLDVLRGLANGAGPEERSLAGRALFRWAQEDLPAALTWVRAVPDPDLRTRLERSIVSATANKSPEAAAALLGEITPDPLYRHSLFTEVASRWAERDALAAVRWVATLTGPDQATAASAAASAWARKEPASALRWASTLSEDAQRQAQSAALGAWAERDPQAALAALRQLPEESQARALQRVLSSYARTDPAAAAALAVRAPPGIDTQWMLAEIAQAWLDRDPRAAASWIEQQQARFAPADLQRLRSGMK